MNIKISKNLITFPLVLRGEWNIKTSIYKSQVLVIANHVIANQMIIRYFNSKNEAVNFINFIVERGYYE